MGLKRLRDYSPLFDPNNDQWYKSYELLGECVQCMLRENPMFLAAVEKVRQEVGDDDNVRFRFNVSEDNTDLLMEATLDWKTEESVSAFLLTKMPVYRVFNKQMQYRALGEEKGPVSHPLKCLLIDASTQGVTRVLTDKGKKLELQDIHSAAEEIRNINEILSKAEQFEPQIFEFDGQNDSLNLLRRKLEETWDVVHFVGHGFCRRGVLDRDDFACLFLPGRLGPVELPIGDIGGWLSAAKTKFLFLNSCQSKDRGMISSLAEKGVPAVLGYRWNVLDESAMKFAESFYKRLVSEEGPLCLDTAFKYAQTTFRNRLIQQGYSPADDPTWAIAEFTKSATFGLRPGEDNVHFGKF